MPGILGIKFIVDMTVEKKPKFFKKKLDIA
jgi:hypothetical protein